MRLDTTEMALTVNRIRKREFLGELKLAVPWSERVSLIAPSAPQTTLRIHFLQQWFNPSDPAMVGALYNLPMFRDLASLDVGEDHLPDARTILRFRRWLEGLDLSVQTLPTVNATLTAKGLQLKKGTVLEITPIVPSNLWMARKRPLAMGRRDGACRKRASGL